MCGKLRGLGQLKALTLNIFRKAESEKHFEENQIFSRGSPQ